MSERISYSHKTGIMTIGEKISNRRRELGLTQEAFAEALEISPQAVSRWENGWNLPDMDRIGQIADVLKTNVSYLIGNDPEDYKWELREQLFSEEHMFTRLKTIAELNGMTETYKALYYIRDKHSGQFRKKLKFSTARIPYIIHPLMMACHALSMGINDDALITVILLHDVCEDCGVAPEELPFSEDVAEAVRLLTKTAHPGKDRDTYTAEYYDAIGGNKMSAVAKILDRCNNISTMAQSFDNRRLAEYITETEQYVYPLLTAVKRNWPEYNNVVFLVRYQMLAVIESLKNMLSGNG